MEETYDTGSGSESGELMDTVSDEPTGESETREGSVDETSYAGPSTGREPGTLESQATDGRGDCSHGHSIKLRYQCP